IESSYGNSVILGSYVKALKEFAGRERRKKEEELKAQQDALNWLVVGDTRVPLNPDATGDVYRPLVVVEDKYTAGLNFTDSLAAKGYVLTITPSRIPDVNVSFPVDKTVFKPSAQAATKAITYADPNGQIYFVLVYLDKLVGEKCPITVAKIYRIDGLSWTGNFQLPFIPTEIAFRTDTNELIIANGDKKITLDKNGKMPK
ncbi:MAG: hypothetical protein HC859_12855, partial [Bacteroidia bacterium]|nr:hypothetical protein [Bacteroidia bacterium]